MLSRASRVVSHVAHTSRATMATFAKEGSDMFCMQCEQTEHGSGCSTIGVCGKDPTTAALQDLLVHQIKGISYWADAARQNGANEGDLTDVNEFTIRALFSTLTNVNFDPTRFVSYVKQAETMRAAAKDVATRAGVSTSGVPHAADFVPPSGDKEELAAAGRGVGLFAREQAVDHDAFGTAELVTYGVKGTAAYATHALELGQTDPEVFSLLHKTMAGTLAPDLTMGDGFGLALEVGGANVKAMALLDAGHRERFGVPAPHAVNHAVTEGKAILVSGHDIADLEALLQQTEGTGVNVYTHGELLPAHSYPGINKYEHLKGNFGGPWQLQRFDFRRFPGPIVMTTNCLQEPKRGYRDRIFTMNEVGWEGIPTVENRDFSKVIALAQELDGFAVTEEPNMIMGGFGHEAILSVADKVLEAAQGGSLERIVLIGGCDGSEGDRSYFTDLAQELPDSAVMLTLGCAKYRLLGKQDYGVLPGTEIPRLLDMGQCNDAYGAVVVAQKLAEALNTDINSLPLSLELSWLEQKAVAVLLSLLHLGVKDIRLGPNPPAFVTPNMLNTLVDGFNLQIIDTSNAKGSVDHVMGRA